MQNKKKKKKKKKKNGKRFDALWSFVLYSGQFQTLD